MTVKGSLEYQGLEQVLRADLAAQGRGRLTLRHGAQYASLFLDPDGLYVLAPQLIDVPMIVDGLVTRDLLDADLVAEHTRRNGGGTALLDSLVESGALPEDEFLEILAREVEDSILDMMLWSEGTYVFEQEPVGKDALGLLPRICVDPVGVAERAAYRLDRRRAIGDRLGDHAILFFADAGDLPPPHDEADRIHEVYAMLDGVATAPEIALRLGVSRYQVLDMVARLAEAGVARVAHPDELSRAAGDMAKQGRHALARALALQWAEISPKDPAPLRKLARLGAEARDVHAQLEALCALGQLFLEAGKHGDALEVFTQAMRHAPADEVVLAGLRVAAEQAGDGDAFVDGTLLTAQTRLDEKQPEAALELLEPLARSYPTNMAVHLLKARALVQSEKRGEFFEQAELVGQVLRKEGCRTRQDRAVVDYFRETIVHLAPERGDLLESFRSIYDPRKRRQRKTVTIVAMLLLVVAAGVYFWPGSAASLLERAQAAADAGETDVALQLVGELIERYPESPETQEAYQLQARLVPSPATDGTAPGPRRLGRQEVEKRLPAFAAALPVLPEPKAQEAVRVVLESLRADEAKRYRKELLTPYADALREAVGRLHAEALHRVEVLGASPSLGQRFQGDPAGLRERIAEAEKVYDTVWSRHLGESADLLFGLSRLVEDASLVRCAQDLDRSGEDLEKVGEYHAQHVPAARLALATMEVAESERRCREEAPKLMVAGRLDEADALYAHLESLLARYEGQDAYVRLLEGARNRQLPELVGDRRGQIRDIRHRLEEAQHAEDEGDLAKAVSIYAALVKKHWLIRFETVCTLPVEIVTVPPGATVRVGGEVLGRSPVIARYAWGSEAAVTVEADGYAPRTEALKTSEDQPASRVVIALDVLPRWTAPLTPSAHARPLATERDVVLVDRRGIVTVLSRNDGKPRWTRDLSSLEGIRARPVLAGGALYVARVDGRIFRLALEDGAVRGELHQARAFGDLAAVGEDVGLATIKGDLVVVRDGKVVRTTPLDGMPTAGVLAAHGAFWIGTAKGMVLRVDASASDPLAVAVTRDTAPVDFVVGTRDGVLVTTSDGVLLALDADGHVRWKRTSLGDLVGAPAQAGGHVVVIVRGGTAHVLHAGTGETVRTLDLGAGAPHGVVADGATAFAVRDDGRLWAYDPGADALLLETRLEGVPDLAPAVAGGSELVTPLANGRLGLLRTPRKP